VGYDNDNPIQARLLALPVVILHIMTVHEGNSLNTPKQHQLVVQNRDLSLASGNGYMPDIDSLPWERSGSTPPAPPCPFFDLQQLVPVRSKGAFRQALFSASYYNMHCPNVAFGEQLGDTLRGIVVDPTYSQLAERR
jgi:hypothetical protein